MKRMLEAFSRALVDSFRPRVIAISLLPLGLMLAAGLLLGYFYWARAVAGVSTWLDSSAGWLWVGSTLAQIGIDNATAFFAPLLVILVATPLLAVLSLLVVAMFMSPALARSVAKRRFPDLARLGSGGFWASAGWTLLSTGLALLALLITLPLWLIPPLALIVPPLIWGWLAFRILSFDALVQHATAAERRLILEQHRWPLLVMGIVCGFLGAVPSIVWASGLLFVLAFPIMVPLAIFIYTWVFALSALWYVHYVLWVLQELRAGSADAGAVVVEAEPVVLLPAPKSDAAAAPSHDAQ
ncbi:hypothetical protein D8I35_04695 [Corticibacter populi]|uniref:EI24 domain-containing protein n=1 Tax=Corticibacter populi TaxID=1550736 RepID=A0A3M6QZI9_9BURK|nr:EI24 domain-containing protein [Corticibacter populi]RMX08388.1 hypothetical protein D8I35_04695 [Corticibacter populi]RZS35690.1 etoposide-induced protein 2.4 (EI24) [Corticibacter populi]